MNKYNTNTKTNRPNNARRFRKNVQRRFRFTKLLPNTYNLIAGTGAAGHIQRIEADADYLIALFYDNEIANIKYGRATVPYESLAHVNLPQSLSNAATERLILEVLAKGRIATMFKIRWVLFRFTPYPQQSINYVGSPMYFKYDIAEHTKEDLIVERPSYIQQNQSRQYQLIFPRQNQQISSTSSDLEEWLPITQENLVAQLSRIKLSAYFPESIPADYSYFNTPLWMVHVKIGFEIKGQEINIVNMNKNIELNLNLDA